MNQNHTDLYAKFAPNAVRSILGGVTKSQMSYAYMIILQAKDKNGVSFLVTFIITKSEPIACLFVYLPFQATRGIKV